MLGISPHLSPYSTEQYEKMTSAPYLGITITSEDLRDDMTREKGRSVMKDIGGILSTARLKMKAPLHRVAYLLNKYLKSK